MSASRSSLIYKVSSEDCDHDSWLVATMHVQDRRAFVHFDKVVELMHPEIMYCSEVDISAMEQNVGQDAFLLPGGQSLEDLVGSRRYSKFQDIARKAFQLDIDQFNDLMPMILINQLSLLVLDRDKALPLDMALWHEAMRMGMPLGGLETIEDQKDVLSSLDVSQQVKMLKDIFRNVKRFRRHTLRLVDTFSQGDLHKLYQLAKKDMGNLRDVLIYKRNENMVGNFSGKHRTQPIIAAVGGGHFAGPFGLISLLRARGFQVKPLGF